MTNRLLLLTLVLLILAGCAGSGGGLGSVSKTNELSPGMKPAEVRTILGEPSQTQFVSNKWVWKYSLHEPWKGFIPYYMVFGRESQTLEQWFADEAEYMRQQQLWLH
jgi:outer membrane protein assembly factor BamE (lipoprotein component of BamABCDE complex)